MLSHLLFNDPDEELNHITMDDLLNEDPTNQDMYCINDYFDEIFEYAMMNELFTLKDYIDGDK